MESYAKMPQCVSSSSHLAALKDYRNEESCIDIVGPYPVSEHDNECTLVVTDCFTKYVEIYPIPNQEFVSRYGGLLEFHSEKETQFESRLFQEMSPTLNSQDPVHTLCDGQSE